MINQSDTAEQDACRGTLPATTGAKFGIDNDTKGKPICSNSYKCKVRHRCNDTKGRPTLLPSSRTAHMPIKQLSSTVQPFRLAPWPMDTLSPIRVGCPFALWVPTYEPSCTLVPAPTLTDFTSPANQVVKGNGRATGAADHTVTHSMINQRVQFVKGAATRAAGEAFQLTGQAVVQLAAACNCTLHAEWRAMTYPSIHNYTK